MVDLKDIEYIQADVPEADNLKSSQLKDVLLGGSEKKQSDHRQFAHFIKEDEKLEVLREMSGSMSGGAKIAEWALIVTIFGVSLTVFVPLFQWFFSS